MLLNRISGGRITEYWDSWDLLFLLQQLGAAEEESGPASRPPNARS